MMLKRMVVAGIVVLLARHSLGPQAFMAGIQIATLAYLVYFDPFKQVLTQITAILLELMLLALHLESAVGLRHRRQDVSD